MSILALEDMQRDYGIGQLTKILNQNQSWKISKIVFMHDGTDIGIPKNLIQCIRELLKTYDPKTLVRKCNYIYLFLYALEEQLHLVASSSVCQSKPFSLKQEPSSF